ncbi:Serine--tRNA ligase [BD1-7 clade bacterium]|uniref:Serine--tRNA ligase n=1 Tax=BD1-7 clade bacterium TaxID=2029982 RepID=A0A5S9QKR0_9GAMM|nr:Serine--tRNA ligase [BD1-7 clade bacterium]CAA0120868.1 Serine--tRNA ligase [BD1-7 clade bacterium]
MLDVKLLRKDIETVAEQLKKKHFGLDVSRFNTLESQRKDSDVHTQNLQSERKKASKKVGELIQTGMSVDDAKKQVAESLKTIDEQLQAAIELNRTTNEEIDAFVMAIPNIPDADVPAGKSEDDNVEIIRWGEPKNFSFDVKDHVDLGSDINQMDFDLGAKITGSRFVVMRGAIARMHRALAQFMLDTHTDKNGYQEVNVPFIVNADSLTGTGQLPKFEEDLFKLESEGNSFYLIPTAEVPVTNIVRDRIIEAQDKNNLAELPLKFASHTPCFRSEAGSYGRDVRGMIRQHQFEKVELVQIVQPEESEQALEDLTGHAEGILQALGLPYRKVMLCGGDLGFSAKRTYDLEVWLPSQNTYREISSCSNFGNYQARRMKARYRNAEGKPELVHTLNGSGLAVGRTLLAVMENYQNADGSIEVPEVLQGYMGGIQQITAG